MFRFDARWTVAMALLLATATAVDGQRLMEMEGIELRGTARIVEYGAGTCNVSEERGTAASYEQKKANHGQAIDIWQLDFSVYNGSGRALDHLIANYRVASENPPCTNWSWPEAGRYPGQIEWGDLAGFIQQSGSGNPTTPGETLTDTKYIFVFHEHQPRFDTWSVDYNFAAPAVGRTEAQTQPPRAAASEPASLATLVGDSPYGTPMEAITARIHFHFDDATLTEDALEILRWKARALQELPDIRLRLEAHTDERGSMEVNQVRGLRMAQAAINFLVFLGVDAGRFEIVTFGEEKPLDLESNEGAWRLNRRVEFVVVDWGEPL